MSTFQMVLYTSGIFSEAGYYGAGHVMPMIKIVRHFSFNDNANDQNCQAFLIQLPPFPYE